MTTNEDERWRRANVRAAEALRLRRSGLLYRQIADHFGVNCTRANQLVRRGERCERSSDYDGPGTLIGPDGPVTVGRVRMASRPI